MFTKSLANTDVQYRLMQARRWNEDRLHIQIEGAPVNRPYGASFTIDVPEAVIQFVEAAFVQTESLGGTGQQYSVIQAKLLTSSRLHVQVSGEEGNRGYGAAFNIDAPVELDSLF